jgi:hypothetical protein
MTNIHGLKQKIKSIKKGIKIMKLNREDKYRIKTLQDNITELRNQIKILKSKRIKGEKRKFRRKHGL